MRFRFVQWLALISAVVVVIPASTPYALAPRSSWFVVLQADSRDRDVLAANDVSFVTLEVGWDAFEPLPGEPDMDYANTIRANLETWTNAGFSVVLDTGLQYPPDWVFELSGATRFVDQYGSTWEGEAGAGPANAVFNANIRGAEERYYAVLSATLGSDAFAAIRVGGLYMGELSYPPDSKGSGSLWMYDDGAQSATPRPGWIPGFPNSRVDSAPAIEFYLDSITGYADWLLGVTSENFPSADLQLLLPSWGLRPGQVAQSIDGGLSGSTAAELNGALTQGLDWEKQVILLSRYGRRGVAYSTWLDAISQGPGSNLISPIAFLYDLGAPVGVPLAGENSGGGGHDALARCLQNAADYNLVGLLWMNAADFLDNARISSTVAAQFTLVEGS